MLLTFLFPLLFFFYHSTVYKKFRHKQFSLSLSLLLEWNLFRAFLHSSSTESLFGNATRSSRPNPAVVYVFFPFITFFMKKLFANKTSNSWTSFTFFAIIFAPFSMNSVAHLVLSLVFPVTGWLVRHQMEEISSQWATTRYWWSPRRPGAEVLHEMFS